MGPVSPTRTSQEDRGNHREPSMDPVTVTERGRAPATGTNVSSAIFTPVGR
jgi:hypothetical protein